MMSNFISSCERKRKNIRRVRYSDCEEKTEGKNKWNFISRRIISGLDYNQGCGSGSGLAGSETFCRIRTKSFRIRIAWIRNESEKKIISQSSRNLTSLGIKESVLLIVRVTFTMTMLPTCSPLIFFEGSLRPKKVCFFQSISTYEQF